MVIDSKRFELMALMLFADRLFSFAAEQVRTPSPLTREAVRAAVVDLNTKAAAARFDSEVDLALYVLASFCFPERAADGSLNRLITDAGISTDEKRYRLSVELDEAGFLPFGALEFDEAVA